MDRIASPWRTKFTRLLGNDVDRGEIGLLRLGASAIASICNIQLGTEAFTMSERRSQM
jgi:hypothetical protein